MHNPSYGDISSASALSEAKRVWESLRPEVVSSHARLLWPDGVERFASRMLERAQFNPATGCAEWQRSRWSHCGYAKAYVGKSQWMGHRLCWLLFVGPIADCILHKCDNRICVNPAHLFCGSRADNTRDMDLKGRRARLVGESVANCKLSVADVLAIRARYKPRSKVDGVRAMARDYRMSWQQISSIVYRRDWAWLPDASAQPTADAPALAQTAP